MICPDCRYPESSWQHRAVCVTKPVAQPVRNVAPVVAPVTKLADSVTQLDRPVLNIVTRTPGRPKVHADHAARQRAYRERKNASRG